jgi:CheY-like chemotaxis protein/anti-sigma regulatory factor (Ser/Thr protein kinase)
LKLSTGQPALFTKDCVDSFATSAQEKNIHLDFKATGLTGLYRFDEEKFEKIIFNLLSNAIKFTPANGEVCVTVEQIENGMLMLTVKDTGPGIPPQQQQKIFDRFYQVADSSIRNYGGTGIGLALVKELTELMNGTIELESKSGGPTTFRVMLPIEKEVAILSSTETAIPISKGKTEDANSNKPLVMIVEDNDELRHFLVTHMRKQYVVLEAADGLRAWEIILNELPDIIISDVMMPGQDGFDLCKSCKTDNRTSHIGLILLTSKAAHDAKLQGLGCGADDYMTKPFHLDELDIIISNQLHLQDNLRKYLQSNLLVKEPALVLPVVTDPFLVKLYEEMDNGLDDSEMGVDYLSKAMAMSRSTLHRKLKSLLHISANDLIRQYRLQKATTFLLAGDDISVAAYKVGFSSPSYFTQCFREQYNVTPSEFIAKEKSS